MTTPPFMSVTDELIAELEAESMHDNGTDVPVSAVELRALLSERAELKRDAERLEWFIKECCVMECMNGNASPIVYRIYWSHEAEAQSDWHASPRKAIDAAMQS